MHMGFLNQSAQPTQAATHQTCVRAVLSEEDRDIDSCNVNDKNSKIYLDTCTENTCKIYPKESLFPISFLSFAVKKRKVKTVFHLAERDKRFITDNISVLEVQTLSGDVKLARLTGAITARVDMALLAVPSSSELFLASTGRSYIVMEGSDGNQFQALVERNHNKL
eukprot:GHVR01087945.1.p1 GENE.GHVR01087945.1~~GHVR01087945.1.p1  ORF type:complete len:166 (-),score=24.06 GHVR01087945.1:258-755(-)